MGALFVGRSSCRLLAGADAGGRQVAYARQGAAYWAALRRGRFREAVRMAKVAWGAPGAGIPWAEGYWAAAMAGDSVAGLVWTDRITTHAARSGMGMNAHSYREPARALF